MSKFTWILDPESKIKINLEDNSDEYELVWKQGMMTLESEDEAKFMTT